MSGGEKGSIGGGRIFPHPGSEIEEAQCPFPGQIKDHQYSRSYTDKGSKQPFAHLW
jgi:hypothetical protein